MYRGILKSTTSCVPSSSSSSSSPSSTSSLSLASAFSSSSSLSSSFTPFSSSLNAKSFHFSSPSPSPFSSLSNSLKGKSSSPFSFSSSSPTSYPFCSPSFPFPQRSFHFFLHPILSPTLPPPPPQSTFSSSTSSSSPFSHSSATPSVIHLYSSPWSSSSFSKKRKSKYSFDNPSSPFSSSSSVPIDTLNPSSSSSSSSSSSPLSPSPEGILKSHSAHLTSLVTPRKINDPPLRDELPDLTEEEDGYHEEDDGSEEIDVDELERKYGYYDYPPPPPLSFTFSYWKRLIIYFYERIRYWIDHYHSARYPFISQMIQSAFLGAAGDLTTQFFERRWDREEEIYPRDWDWRRAGACAAFGVLWMGPIGHLWYESLTRFCHHWCRNKTTLILVKISSDTILFGPITLWLFIAYVKCWEVDPHEHVANRLWRDFYPTYLVDYSFWPVVQAINFYFVPLRYQLFVVNVMCYFDDVFLSYVAHNSLPGIFDRLQNWWEDWVHKNLQQYGGGQSIDDMNLWEEEDEEARKTIWKQIYKEQKTERRETHRQKRRRLRIEDSQRRKRQQDVVKGDEWGKQLEILKEAIKQQNEKKMELV